MVPTKLESVARLQAAERLAMAIRTTRRCAHVQGDAKCSDQTCRALAAWEALSR